MISICDNGRLKITIFQQSVSKNSPLREDINNLRNLIKNIPKGQFLWLRQNCSEDDDFQSKTTELKESFKTRGYTITYIDSAFQRAVATDKHSLLDKMPKCQTSSRICFSTV